MPKYKVVDLREGLMGGKMSGDELEKILNEHGSKATATTTRMFRVPAR